MRALTAVILFVAIFAPVAGCKSRRHDSTRANESEQESVSDASSVKDESALQEYVNEPKRRAQNVKSNLEAAQDRARDQAALMDD